MTALAPAAPPTTGISLAPILAATLDTPVGPLSLLLSDGGLVAAGFTAAPETLRVRLRPARRTAPLRATADAGPTGTAVAAYFDGELDALDAVALVQDGGTFHQRAWAALRRIPPGSTVTYRQLAALAGSPAASRAAGSACARNLVAPFVPCHRVVRGDGELGGYAYGMEVKRRLLAHERSAGA